MEARQHLQPCLAYAYRVMVISPAYARMRIHVHAHAHVHVHAYAPPSTGWDRQEDIGTAIRHSRNRRHGLHRPSPSMLASMSMSMPISLWCLPYGNPWEPMGHERMPTRGQGLPFGRNRVEARIRHDDAFMVQDPHGFGFSAYSVDSV